MVIIISLPKSCASFLLIYEACLLLKTLGQLKKVAIRLLTEGQEMQAVGHYAIGINHKLVKTRFGSQSLDNPCGSTAVVKNWLPTLAAHCEE
jgi:hypothetical protein